MQSLARSKAPDESLKIATKTPKGVRATKPTIL